MYVYVYDGGHIEYWQALLPPTTDYVVEVNCHLNKKDNYAIIIIFFYMHDCLIAILIIFLYMHDCLIAFLLYA